MSQFEDLPLPVNRDAQDYSRLVPANSTVEIPVVGEFVYCKFSDGSIRVVINGKSTLMESGDERRSGGTTVFRGVTLINDTDVAKSIIFVIGFGGFDRKIVQGEIMIEPGLRKADGSFVTDTRRTIKIDLVPVNIETDAYTAGDLIETIDASQNLYAPFTFVLNGDNNNPWFIGFSTAGGIETLVKYDKRLSLQSVEPLAPRAWSASEIYGATYRPGVGILALYRDGTVRKIANVNTNAVIKTFFAGADWVSMQWISSLGQYLGVQHSIKNLYFLNSIFEIQTVLPIPDVRFFPEANTCATYDEINNQFLYGRSQFLTVLSQTGDVLYEVETPTATKAGTSERPEYEGAIFTADGQSVFYNGESDNGATDYYRPLKQAFRDFETRPEISSIKPGCELSNSLEKPVSLVQIRANVTASQLQSGVVLSGEVIRGALEYYFKQAAPTNYLDSVYQFDISRDGTGQRFNTINTGNRSFLASGIADDFAMLLPGQVVLVIDNKLKFTGGL